MLWCFLCERAAGAAGWMDGWSERGQAGSSFAAARCTLFFVCWEKLGETFSPTFIGQEPPLSTCYHWPRLAHALPYGANPLGPVSLSAIKYLARSFTTFAAADDAQALLIPTQKFSPFLNALLSFKLQSAD